MAARPLFKLSKLMGGQSNDPYNSQTLLEFQNCLSWIDTQRKKNLLNIGNKLFHISRKDEYTFLENKMYKNDNSQEINQIRKLPDFSSNKFKRAKPGKSIHLLSGYKKGHNLMAFQKRNFCSKYKNPDECPPKIVRKKDDIEYVKLCGLGKLQRKTLPKIPEGCCCVEPPPITDVKPFRRLKAREIPEPEKICKKEECGDIPRADKDLEIEPKELPILENSKCPCFSNVEFVDVELKRLPKKQLPEPEKCQIEKPCTTPRADESLCVEPKQLPLLENSDCPCVDREPLKDMTFKRLKKVVIPEPERFCKVELCSDNPRADDDFELERKSLPEIVSGECPCIPVTIADAPPLPKLKPKPVEEKPRVCPIYVCPPRADESLCVEPKQLPLLENSDCPCVDREPLKNMTFKRLKKVVIPEPERFCKVELCSDNPRADADLEITKKSLPEIVSGECPCIPIRITDAPPLPKLKPKPVEEKPRVCPIYVCPPRADDSLCVKPKNLPLLENSDCPCIDREPLVDVVLKRLPKVVIPEPEKICPVEVCEREPQPVIRKKLPVLEPSKCPCVNPKPPKDVPKLRRLQKCPELEPPKSCIKIGICDETPRSDKVGWTYSRKFIQKAQGSCDRAPIKGQCDETVKTNKIYINKISKRNYSTNCSRTLGTESSPIMHLLGQSYLCRYPIDSNNCKQFQKPHNDQNKNEKSDIAIEKFNTIVEKPVAIISSTKNTNILPYLNISYPTYYLVNMAQHVKKFLMTLTLRNGKGQDLQNTDGTTPKHTLVMNLERAQIPFSPLLQIEKNENSPYKTNVSANGRADTRWFSSTSKTINTKSTCYPKDAPNTTEILCKKKNLSFAKRKAEAMTQECGHLQKAVCADPAPKKGVCPAPKKDVCPARLSWWERIKIYFKARPCPSPQELRMQRLRIRAEKAAKEAGLCLYDPKEEKEKKKTQLPKIIRSKYCKHKPN